MQGSNSKVTTWKAENAILFPEIIRMLNEGHTATLPLRGFSMRPFLEDGRDSALLKKLGDVKIGDPVLAEIKPGKWVLHRLIAIDGDNVTLLGDGNLTPEYCKKEDLRAEVVGFYRKKRTTLDSVKGRKWKLYSWFWMHLLPVRITRRIVLALYRRWIKLFGTI